MIRHFFKLTWNKKKRHMLLVIELFFAYLVICFLILFLFQTAFYHFKAPKFNIDNLISFHIGNPNDTIAHDAIKQSIRTIKEVQHISLTDLMPYNNIVSFDTLQYGNETLTIYKWNADEQLHAALKLSMQSGRWFQARDRSSVKSPVIITSTLKRQLLHGKNAEGTILKVDSKEYMVIGVVEDLNDPTGNYHNRLHPHLFVLSPGYLLLVKLKEPLTDAIYKKLRSATSDYSEEFSDRITPVKEYKEKFSSRNDQMTIVMAGLSGFLIINVILGLFAMLYQNINRRRSEIGLRMATGATSAHIYRQMVMEVILLATLAMLPGVIVACQFALFKVFGDYAYYYNSMLISAIIIYVLVILCALYPARLASKIQPAEALHEE